MDANGQRLSTSSNPGGAIVASSSNPTVQEVQEWSSVVVDYTLRFEHVALDISTDRILYHLDLEFEQPIPASYMMHFEYLSLGWPLGGIWQLKTTTDDNRRATCVAWKKTDLMPEDVVEIAKKYTPLEVSIEDKVSGNAPIRPPPVTLFDWKMQLGTWDNRSHWFVREVGALPTPDNANPEVPEGTLLTAQLLAGLQAVEVSLVVNGITAVETVAQTFDADVTWELTLPGLTTMREDSVLREFLDLIEFKEDDLEFSNISEVQSEKPLVTILSPAGRVKFVDPFAADGKITTEKLHHLKYSRRVVGVFTEEMSLFYFPFDQQKLTFTFNMSKSIRSSIQIAPPSADAPGRFALENFKMSNVFDVACGDKLFIGEVVDSGSSKLIRFEMMLQRRSAYYMTNVALPAAIITYLSFVTYAPTQEDGSLMDMGNRLQVVVTLLLTDVTFKSMVASLIPQVSYFTTLDKYVFVCFIITCVVTLENALFPFFTSYLPEKKDGYSEDSLLGISFYGFTLVNLVWGLYIMAWYRKRNERTKILLLVNEYARAIAQAIPNAHKEQVLRGYLKTLDYNEADFPELVTTKRGDLFVRLPSDSPTEGTKKSPHEPTSGIFRKQAMRDLPEIQKLYSEMAPSMASVTPSSPVRSVPSPTEPAAGIGAVVAKEYSSAPSAVVVNVDVQENQPITPYKANYGSFRAN
ncbi:hypothetical protein FI667_g4865, partial [Globisporangium splendens]